MPIVEMKHKIEGEILIFFEYLYWRQDTQDNHVQHNDTDIAKHSKIKKKQHLIFTV
jgi:hypothetical protein